MTINPEQERFEARRAHSRTVEIDTCHVSLVARPDAVADLILQAAAADGPRPQLAKSGTDGPAQQTTVLGAAAAALLATGGGLLLRGRRKRRQRH
jgi:LPXTG-motif cell wall-anchored protein